MSQRAASSNISYSLVAVNGGPPPNENVVPCTWNFDFNNIASTAYGHYEYSTIFDNYKDMSVSVTVTTY